jgi:two-component sensor histidine kinase
MSTPGAAGRFRRFSVTALIIVLILAVAAPSLTFSGLLLLQSDTITRRTMEARAEEGVRAVSDTLDREFRAMATNLVVFASGGAVETGEYARLHARASKALGGTDSFLAVVDADMNILMSTRVPYGTPVGAVSSQDTIRAALASGRPTVSDVLLGRLSQTEAFGVVLPLLTEGPPKAIVLGRNASSLAPLFKNSLPQAGWSYAVLDRKGKLASGKAPAIGPPQLLSQLCSDDKPGLHEQKIDGVSFSSASRMLDLWGWRACVWTSSDQTEASISQRWRNFTVLTFVIVAVTILAGAALGRVLTSAIRRAATVGRALDAGGQLPETRSRVREVDDVLATLTRAARVRLQQEQDLKVLLRETAHRAKNQIAIASALARLSARSAASTEQLRDDIVARLAALGRSIDMMSASPSGAVRLKELAATQLEPFAVDHPGRLELVGPDLYVAPATAQSLGLVLHEMATNAAKYGAWSTEHGKVRLDWSEDATGLTIVWSEHDGPAAKAPSRSGFGSSLIEMMIERSLGGTVQRDYQPEGLVATFKLPVRPVTV